MASHRRIRRNAILLPALAALTAVLVGIVWREIRQQRLNHALIAAVKHKADGTVVTLLGEGADPAARDPGDVDDTSLRGILLRLIQRFRGGKSGAAARGRAALTLAVEQDDAAIVKALLARAKLDTNADAVLSNSELTAYHAPLLVVAAERNNVEIVRALLDQGADIEGRDIIGQTALLSASGAEEISSDREPPENKAQMAEVVQLLLQRGANANAVSNDGAGTLTRALNHGTSRVVKDLLDHGADPNENDAGEYTALDLAVQEADLPLIKRLLSEGAHVNPGDPYIPPIVCAQSLAVLKLLLAHGADVHVRDRFSENADSTALEEAAQKDAFEAVKILLAHGADINGAPIEPALTWAAESGRPAMVRYMLQHGARVNARGSGGTTALIAAVEQGRADNVDVLLECGADPNLRSDDKSTALMIAAESRDGHTEEYIAAALIEFGADVNAKDRSGATAISIAQDNQNRRVIALLKKAGAHR